jgi:hypothetical protein
MATQDSRIKIKRSTIAATVPTVPSSNDHTDGTWISTDIYKGELFYNQADGVLWTRDDNGVTCLGGSASLTIASADVLTLNTTPLTIVGAVAGYAIEVVSASVKIAFGSVAYATNTTLQLQIAGADDNVGQIGNNILLATVDQISSAYAPSNPSSGQTQVLANAALQVKVAIGDPTAGDSDITVYVNYRLIPA